MTKRKAPAPPSGQYINREQSWLEFNSRVLGEAADPANPLLERLKFLGIVASNIDEFFMVRVAGLVRLVEAEVPGDNPDGLSPRDQLVAIRAKVRAINAEMDRLLTKELLPALKREKIMLLQGKEAEEAAKTEGRDVFVEHMQPVLTPMAIDQGHPFPVLQNQAIYQFVELEGMPGGAVPAPRNVIVQLPTTVTRFQRLSDSDGYSRFILLGDIMRHNLSVLYPEATALRSARFRITRDSDFTVDEEGAEDLLKAIEKELLGRKQRAPVRLECDASITPGARAVLLENLELGEDDVYTAGHLLDMSVLLPLSDQIDRPDLKFPLRPPLHPFEHDRQKTIFDIIREKDRILFHPYHSFEPVEELVSQAADDPRVLAVKQTLYRTSSDSPIIAALEKASLNGKHVTVLVELKARFDEQRNIQWARRLERAGAHVIYGLVGLKTHCKALMVVRRDDDGIRRYLHLGTGNYNSRTAKLYTDVGLLTCDRELGDEVAALFNVITGYTRPGRWRHIDVSPITMRGKLCQLIQREAENARAGRPSGITAKMNALVDLDIIQQLYNASQAGVSIDLVVRGICCLVPGVPGLSENIRVRSIVGRYLEHSRIFRFANGGEESYYLSSADWMPRNLDRRIELLFPITDPEGRSFVAQVLALQMQDTAKAHLMRPEGTYAKPALRKGEAAVNSQDTSYDLVRGRLKDAQKRSRQTLLFKPAKAPE